MTHNSLEIFDPLSPGKSHCERCGCELDETPVSLVEAFEITGQWLCDDCAEEAFDASEKVTP